MSNIINKIKEAQDAYYNGSPIMTDAEFDALYEAGQLECPNDPIFTGVGEDSTDGFAKCEHFIPMGSQAKATTKEQIAKFLKDNNNGTYIAEDKCDGISIELVYRAGKFVQAITRGNGTIGDDITNNVSKMKGFPRTVLDVDCSVRGEILLFHSDKDKYFPELKNCRNAASGIAKRLDGSDCDKLTIVAYDVRGIETLKTEDKIIAFLQAQGFSTVASTEMTSADEAFTFLEKRMNDKEREYDIDGIVIKKKEIDYADQKENVRPKSNIALKPAYNLAETVIRDIEWNLSAGTLTPIAVFDPVEIDGATISRASLSNVALMEQMGIEIGKRIIVSRRNMVIPHVEKVID